MVGGSAAIRSRSHPPPKSTPLGFRVLLPPSLPPSHGGKFHAGGCLRRASTICQSTPLHPPFARGEILAGGRCIQFQVWALPCCGHTPPRFAQQRTSSRAAVRVWALPCRGSTGALWGALERSSALWDALGHSGALWGAPERSGALWALGRCRALWGALGRSGALQALWGALGRCRALWGALGRSGAL